MKMHFKSLVCLAVLSTPVFAAQHPDPLPSWNDGATKSAIVEFVETVTTKGSDNYVPAEERIAVFDNDGTLWAEKPMYFQLFFTLDRIKELAPKHPEWKTEEPFASVLKGDIKAALSHGEEGLLKMVMATHAGMNSVEFEEMVQAWVKNAKHPITKRPLTEMIYQPMLEVLDFLRDNDFKTYIVSGGGADFMRPWTEEVYGISPEYVIGSEIETEFAYTSNGIEIQRLANVAHINDKAGKVIGIHKRLGRQPIAAFGNSDGDLQMMQWTTQQEGVTFGLYVHHTDEGREWKYDRNSSVGRLDKGLDEAKKEGWTIADMKNDWKVIYPN
ncbi:haloacid dehalogenase-like hydrolase [Vibrio mediterranei]|uniref:HAD family hydrolase n=1 Tax=Vibrio mediterranei TaxID=689 RepID=UPI0017D48AF3|nr:HAD family hydrolase [Vibrio mediterranei]NUW72150.1 haloacid dehalogenase-like hydrolase [Vibrio mediterranei]